MCLQPVCKQCDYRGLYLAAWIDLLFNEDDFLLYSRQQNTPVDYSFVHLTKKASDCCQISILQNSQKKMVSNKQSETAIICEILLRIRWYFFRISLIKIGFSTEQTNLIFDKNVIELSFFCNFLNRMRIQLPNLRQPQYVSKKLWKFQTNCSNTIFVVWVRVNWDKVYIGLLCTCSSAVVLKVK